MDLATATGRNVFWLTCSLFKNKLQIEFYTLLHVHVKSKCCCMLTVKLSLRIQVLHWLNYKDSLILSLKNLVVVLLHFSYPWREEHFSMQLVFVGFT